MNHNQIQNLAEAYALGVLDPEEKALFETHLQQNCISCQKALAESQEAVGFLALNVDPIIPPSHLKSQILSEVLQTSTPSYSLYKEKIKNGIIIFYMKWFLFSRFFNKLRAWTKHFSLERLHNDPAHLYIREEDGHWETISLGVKVKILFTDFQQGVSTLLMRMEAGSRIPSHVHHGIEQIYLLEGEASSGDILLKANDYFRAEATSFHHEVTTKNGCMMLMIAPDIEWLPTPSSSFKKVPSQK